MNRKPLKACQSCGNVFLDVSPRFTSTRCYDCHAKLPQALPEPDHWEPIRFAYCGHCGRVMLDERNKYCSPECVSAVQAEHLQTLAEANRKPKPSKPCRFCGRPFNRVRRNRDAAVFCSRQCAGKWRTARRRQTTITIGPVFVAVLMREVGVNAV